MKEYGCFNKIFQKKQGVYYLAGFQFKPGVLKRLDLALLTVKQGGTSAILKPERMELVFC